MGKKQPAPNPDLRTRQETIEHQVAELYTDEVVAHLSEILEPFASNEARRKFPSEIRDWAVGFLALREARRNSPPFRAAHREELVKLATAARKLVAAYSALSETSEAALHTAMLEAEFGKRGLLDDFSNEEVALTRRKDVSMELVEDMRQAAERVIEGRPVKPGPDKSFAQRTALLALITLYRKATGREKEANRVYDGMRDDPYGPFTKFATAVMCQIEPKTDSAIDSALQRIKEDMLKRKAAMRKPAKQKKLPKRKPSKKKF